MSKTNYSLLVAALFSFCGYSANAAAVICEPAFLSGMDSLTELPLVPVVPIESAFHDKVLVNCPIPEGLEVRFNDGQLTVFQQGVAVADIVTTYSIEYDTPEVGSGDSAALFLSSEYYLLVRDQFSLAEVVEMFGIPAGARSHINESLMIGNSLPEINEAVEYLQSQIIPSPAFGGSVQRMIDYFFIGNRVTVHFRSYPLNADMEIDGEYVGPMVTPVAIMRSKVEAISLVYPDGRICDYASASVSESIGGGSINFDCFLTD